MTIQSKLRDAARDRTRLSASPRTEHPPAGHRFQFSILVKLALSYTHKLPLSIAYCPEADLTAIY
jgi:hypothetical protein